MTVDSGRRLFLDSVDDYLGPSESRFFGSGYRRVGYTISDTVLVGTGGTGGTGASGASGASGGAGPSVRARAGISYPPDWSTKAEGDELRPHLSTIDALILAVRFAEFLARHTHGLGERQRSEVRLHRVDIKAGSSAVEDGLGDLPVSAAASGSAASADHPGTVISTYDCRVSGMKIRVELIHEAGLPVPAGPHVDAQLGSGYPGLYGSGFQRTRQLIRDVAVDVAAGSADATVDVVPPDAREFVAGGLEAAYGPAVSLIDSFVVALQLGQILLYETDGMKRGESNTLWMRRTTLTAGPAELRPAGGSSRETTSLEDAALVPAQGGLWRTATIVGDVRGVRTRCVVTHRLPDRA
ncbi:AvrD family protein [Streptomyces polygonati]|uniref:AvrD family protein n=1 Tax=Streptomyces polygonati TaxID=1617087 RepID=A0ABV8HPU3_9ACTN